MFERTKLSTKFVRMPTWKSNPHVRLESATEIRVVSITTVLLLFVWWKQLDGSLQASELEAIVIAVLLRATCADRMSSTRKPVKVTLENDSRRKATDDVVERVKVMAGEVVELLVSAEFDTIIDTLTYWAPASMLKAKTPSVLF